MAAIATKPKHQEVQVVGLPTARFGDVVDRTAKLSEELLKSFETNERAAIETIGRFVITIEEAVPQEVTGTTEVVKKVTESGLEMTDRLLHTGYDLLREVVDRAADSMSRHDGAKAVAA